MLRITCPHCGVRSLIEWVYGEILDTPEGLTDVSLDRAFNHTNSPGIVTEAWFHAYGCRRWVTVRRDTTTDTFLA